MNRTIVPNYLKGDYDRLCPLLGEVSWVQSFRDRTAQEMWDIFKGVIKKIVEQCIPDIVIRSGSRKLDPGNRYEDEREEEGL